MKHPPQFITIIAQYQLLLERYARRLLQNKLMAYTAVKEVFEELYDQDKLYVTPNLRNLLKSSIEEACKNIDLSIARAELALADKFLSDHKN